MREKSNARPDPSTSRGWRSRLEVAQGRRKSLEQELSTQDLASPLPETLEEIAACNAASEALLARLPEVSRRREAAQRDHAIAEQEVVRREPMPRAAPLVTANVLLFGFLVGGTLAFTGHAWLPALQGLQGGLLLAGVSGLVLLRAAWRLGRVSGARAR